MSAFESDKNPNMGPMGLGDPNDNTLRKVESEILIPKIMRDRAKSEKCIPEVGEFEKCCKDSGLKMVYSCRPQNDGLKACLTEWYKNEEFKAECRDIYLKQRSEYRRTGIKKAFEKKK